jgi:hypothetical protein
VAKRPNSRVWNEEDTERLRHHIARGGSAFRAAAMFKRSEQAVRAQASLLNLKFPTILELRKKACGPGGHEESRA